MEDDNNETTKNLIALVVGGVLLFGAISVVPIIIMRLHRRRAAERHASELQRLDNNGCMRQTTVERWLLDQQAKSDSPEVRYAGEPCPVCLSALFASSTFSSSAQLSQARLPSPEPAHIPPRSPCTRSSERDDDRTRHGHRGGPDPDPEQQTRVSGVLILNRCNHAFHAGCLMAWFERGQYRCPVCSAPYP